MRLLYSITLFAGAALLFFVQPMAARIVLPVFGGAPAVWNVCMVFFQAALLAGYLYAHGASRLPLPLQGAFHLALLAGAFCFLPISISGVSPSASDGTAAQSFHLLKILFGTVGLPFFVVSTTAPLLQKWFAASGDPAAGDPYFLYSASNIGSLGALIAFPVFAERFLTVPEQAQWWRYGFLLLGVAIAGCFFSAFRNRKLRGTSPSPIIPAGISWSRRLRWIALAAAPSSLFLGVTNYFSTDIASIPLLWVVPLAIYLLTFVIAFAKKPILRHSRVLRILPMAAIALLFAILSHAAEPLWLLLLIHLVFLFIASLACHGSLVSDRPDASRLTDFYICLSIGGMIGGLVNGLVAPALFRSVAEYPIAIVASCLLALQTHWPPRRELARDLPWSVAIGAWAMLSAWLVTAVWRMHPGLATNAIVFAIPVLFCFLLSRHPVRFAASAALLLWAGAFFVEMHGPTLHAERSFFGVIRVTRDPEERLHRFVHGNTTHGRQFLDASRQCEPLAYYHRSGPLGTVFKALDSRLEGANIGVIGLGTGSMIAYAKPGQSWTFYEIDPAVIRIAQDARYFTYLSRCAAVAPRIVPGDGRLRLRESSTGYYELLVLDAFSSDSVPVHLLTREAFSLFISRLKPGGVFAMHISNRYLNLEPVVVGVARESGLVGWSCVDDDENPAEGKEPSHWVLVARKTDDVGPISKNPRWITFEALPSTRPWTDDYSNILSVFQWR